jgi:spermidine synthase
VETQKSTVFLPAILVTGSTGIIAQTVILRELLISFSGNELSIGVIIGSWVVWEALGAFTAGTGFWKPSLSPRVFVYATVLFSVTFPFCIYLTRVVKLVIGFPQEVGLGVLAMFYSSMLIMLPIGFIHGFLFTLMCTIYEQFATKGSASAGKVYFYEMLGTIVGGILVTYLFIPYFHSFHISMGLMLFSAVASFLAFKVLFCNRAWDVAVLSSLLLLLPLTLLFTGVSDRLHEEAIRKQWQGKNVVHYENSLYQNIVVVQNENQFTFFTDGIPLITAPVPDIMFVEEFAHIPLLSHPSPRTILILSGGAGGVIREILKHTSIKDIDYVETDPALLKVVKRYHTTLTRHELANPSVHLHYMDARLFLSHGTRRYDVILMGLPAPSTLQTNRFYTEEFFRLARAALRKDGVLAFTLPGSLTYYSGELALLNRSILKTLEAAFQYTFVLPGDTNILMASSEPAISRLSSQILAERLAGAKIETNLITPVHLSYRFEDRWKDWFNSTLRETHAPANEDLRPIGLFLNTAYRNLLFSPGLKPYFDAAQKISMTWLLPFVVLLGLLLLSLKRWCRGFTIPFAIATTGFASMVLELILLFTFQVFYGYVFHKIGLLITAFMAGLALGSLVVTSGSTLKERAFPLLKVLEATLIGFSLAVLLILELFYRFSLDHRALEAAFLFLLLASGFLTGAEFPLAVATRAGHHPATPGAAAPSLGETVGIVYGADLIGGWVGGLLGSLVLVPILGISAVCLFLASLKAVSLTLLLTYRDS